MSHHIVFAPEARDDLQRLYIFIADRAGDDRALAYLERIERFCAHFTDFPERGTCRDEIFPGLRVVGFERRITIAFRVEPRRVVFDRFLYGGRDLASAFDG